VFAGGLNIEEDSNTIWYERIAQLPDFHSFNGCILWVEVIGDIFKTGFYSGIFLVVWIIGVIIFIVAWLNRKK
jgi:hypothetical protein